MFYVYTKVIYGKLLGKKAIIKARKFNCWFPSPHTFTQTHTNTQHTHLQEEITSIKKLPKKPDKNNKERKQRDEKKKINEKVKKIKK